MNRPWTLDEKELVRELFKTGEYTYQEIADQLYEAEYKDRSAEAVRGMLKRARLGQKETIDTDEFEVIWEDPDYDYKKSAKEIKGLVEEAGNKGIEANLFMEEEIEPKFLNTLESIDDLRDMLTGMTVPHFKLEGRPKEANIKVLSLSDLHIPFHNSEVIADALTQHSDADILVLNGDILDLYSVSRFPKSKEILLRHEYKIALEMIKLFSEIFPQVILIHGNHEERMKALLSNSLIPGVSFMTDDDILSKLAEGKDINNKGRLQDKYDFSNVSYEGGPLRWYRKIGKTLFAHPSYFSRVPMKTVHNAMESLSQKEDFECIVLGHTHKIGQVIVKNKLLIEQGCCCSIQGYEANAKAQFTPQAFGYAIVFMNEKGEVDFNKTKAVYYGSEGISKDYLDRLKEAQEE